MTKPLCLDLYCKAGGTSKGYQQAGFYVVGVDIEPQPHYIGDDFLQADALEVLRILVGGGCIIGQSGRVYYLADFDLIAASPPCQAYSISKNNGCHKDAPELIEPTRELLVASGKPYVIENVAGAPLLNPIQVCGASFGLGASGFDLNRHRYFESNMMLLSMLCQHKRGKTIGVYGNGTNSYHLEKFGRCITVAEIREAMGIDWMTRAELSQAIPPAYTHFIGQQIIELIKELTQ